MQISVVLFVETLWQFRMQFWQFVHPRKIIVKIITIWTVRWTSKVSNIAINTPTKVDTLLPSILHPFSTSVLPFSLKKHPQQIIPLLISDPLIKNNLFLIILPNTAGIRCVCLAPPYHLGWYPCGCLQGKSYQVLGELNDGWYRAYYWQV